MDTYHDREKQEETLENIIQAHLYGYWFLRIKHNREEEEILQTAEKSLEELKSISQSPATFVVWEDFDEDIHCAIFGSYSDFQEWSQAGYIFRILDVL